MALDTEIPTALPEAAPASTIGTEVIEPHNPSAEYPPMDIDSLNAMLDGDTHGGIREVADYDPSVFEVFDPPAEAPRAPDKAPDAAPDVAPDKAPATPADAEPAKIVEARKRVAEGNPSPADLRALERHDAEVKSQKDLKDAYAAVAGGSASEDQRRMVAEDTTKRDNERIANRKSELNDLKGKIKNDGSFDDPNDTARFKEFSDERKGWEDLTARAEAGEKLSEDEQDALEEGNKMYKEDADAESDIVDETEGAKLERMQAELEAATEEMLSTEDPDKKAELMSKVADLRAETLGMKQTLEDKDRDKKVLSDAFKGKRTGEGLVKDEKRAKNERVRELLDQMLADAAELLTIERRMKAMEAQRKAVITKIKAGTTKLGRSSSDIEKFKITAEGVALYRQLNTIDETMENTAEAGINFAQRYYKNVSEVRRRLKVRGPVMRVLESVGFGVMRATLSVNRYSRRSVNLFA